MNQGGRRSNRRHGFTRAELVAIVLLVSIFASLALPIFGDTRSKSRATLCLSAMRQLAVAAHLYTDENDELLVLNARSGSSPAWVGGFLSWDTSSDNTNMVLLRSPQDALLGPYVRTSENVHKCPEDTFLSAVQRARKFKERVRSFSVNGTVGGVIPFSNGIYRPAVRLADLLIPGPAQTTVFLEEHPDFIGDGRFVPPQERGSWWDVPAAFHQGAASFAFADGHVELHRWRGQSRKMRVTFTSSPLAPRRPNDPDVKWMSYHSVRESEESL